MSQAQLAHAAGVAQPNLSAYENGRRSPSRAVLERISRALETPPAVHVDRHREAIHEIIAQHHASSPRIFGSVARGDAVTGSDIDILVDFTDEASLLDEVGLRLGDAPGPAGWPR